MRILRSTLFPSFVFCSFLRYFLFICHHHWYGIHAGLPRTTTATAFNYHDDDDNSRSNDSHKSGGWSDEPLESEEAAALYILARRLADGDWCKCSNCFPVEVDYAKSASDVTCCQESVPA
jgi:hypothetical protein